MTDVAQPRNTATVVPEAMSWDSHARRVVFIYVPLACFILCNSKYNWELFVWCVRLPFFSQEIVCLLCRSSAY